MTTQEWDEYNRIVDKIDDHIQSRGGPYSAWYVGITDDADRRLFMEHRVNNVRGRWIYHKASTVEIARKIEEHFLGFGCQGGTGGGSQNSQIVYAYRITSETVE